MDRVIARIKNINLGKIITVFLSVIIMFVSTACSGGAQAKTPAPGKTADQVRHEVPSGAVTSEYKGGMNDYSDLDPRADFSDKQAKAKGLVDLTERQVIDETDDVGTNTKRILDKKGENARDLGKNAKEDFQDAGDKAQKSVRDFSKGTQRGIENIKDNTQDSVSDANKSTMRAADNVKENSKDAGKNVFDSAKDAADQASSYVQNKTNEAVSGAKRAID